MEMRRIWQPKTSQANNLGRRHRLVVTTLPANPLGACDNDPWIASWQVLATLNLSMSLAWEKLPCIEPDVAPLAEVLL